MGTSFIGIEEKGFWLTDISARIWLLMLGNKIDDLELNELWILDLRNEWLLNGLGLMTGCTICSFDLFIYDTSKRDVVLKIIEKKILDFEYYKTFLPFEELNELIPTSAKKLLNYKEDFTLKDYEHFTSRKWYLTENKEIKTFRNIGILFKKLILGEIQTTASTSSANDIYSKDYAQHQ